jgi:hypothetical protein
MQTLIDPFELASRRLPTGVPQSGPRLRDPDATDETPAAPVVRFPMTRSDSPARLRCWCSED